MPLFDSSQTSQNLSRFLEPLLAFIIGAILMHVTYGAVGGSGGQIGVPGRDSFYHLKMAAMLPEHGLLKQFPWLRFCYFTDSGEAFVSHHYGFHVLLLPFVRFSRWVTGDYQAGGRWAITAFFGMVALLFVSLLRAESIHGRWFWLLLLGFLPYQFFTRHAFVRAISVSLAFMLLILLLAFRRRYVWMALAIAAYIHVYLGGVLYAPILVGLYVLSVCIGPPGERESPWRLAAFAAAGWLLGVLLHPYRDGIAEFLRLQVFGSGLSPDISVGREWNSYENVWFFANMSGVLLTAWAAAMALRLRLGPSLNPRELCVLLISFVFLALTLKARRFIEYWPMFSLLSTAMLAEPMLRGGKSLLNGFWSGTQSAPGGGATACSIAPDKPCLPSGQGVPERSSRRNPPLEIGLSVIWIILLIGVAAMAGYVSFGAARASIRPALGIGLLVALGLAYAILAWLGRLRTSPAAGTPAGFRLVNWVRGARVMTAEGAAFVVAACLGAKQWHTIQQDSRCRYDLPAIQAAMNFLRENSQPGDVVFTDDWDVFPVFFYYNTHNHYIVGLDPKFTHHRQPELWERYVKISRGQVPTNVTVKRHDRNGPSVKETFLVRLEDIRDHFGARFVVTDRDHQALAGRLAAADNFARLVFPEASYAKARNAPYLVFRVLETAEQVTPSKSPDDQAILYLSDLEPTLVEQEWGTLMHDRSVSDLAIILGEKAYDRGLGTHAASKIEYLLPAGFERFEAVVGVDDGVGGQGSVIVSVYLDGREAYRSPVLVGGATPASLLLPLRGARQLSLRADSTEDGNRFDHVDWADAKLRGAGPAAPEPDGTGR